MVGLFTAVVAVWPEAAEWLSPMLSVYVSVDISGLGNAISCQQVLEGEGCLERIGKLGRAVMNGSNKRE